MRFRNEEFFQFFTEFKDLVSKYEVDSNFFGEYVKLIALYNELDDSLELVRKSNYTSEIVELDKMRDKVFLGLKNTIKALQNHFDEDKQKASTRLMLVFKTYGNVKEKGYAAETATIYNLVKDLNEKYEFEIEILELQGWVDKLDEYNNSFSKLMSARDKEKSEKPQKRVVDIRKEMEICYRNIIRFIEVAMFSEPDDNLISFVNELLSKIVRFANILSLREGRAAAKKADKQN